MAPLIDFSLTLDVEVEIYAQMLPLLFREKSSNSTFLYKTILRNIIPASWVHFVVLGLVKKLLCDISGNDTASGVGNLLSNGCVVI